MDPQNLGICVIPNPLDQCNSSLRSDLGVSEADTKCKLDLATNHLRFPTRLYINLLVDSLTEYAYHAEVAGLSYHISSQSNGLLVSMEGVCAT